MLTVLKSWRKALALTLALAMLLAVFGCSGNHPAEENPKQEVYTYTQEEMGVLRAEIDRFPAENKSPVVKPNVLAAEGEDVKMKSKTDAGFQILDNVVPVSSPVGNITAIAFNKSTDLQDAVVPTGVTPAKSFVTEVGKTYRLPDDVKKSGDTYETSNSKILTVEKDIGRFKTIANGTAYIVVTNGPDKRYLKVTVGSGTLEATTQTTVSGALAGHPVTVTDKTTPAVTVGGFKSNGVYAMYFQSANGVILGSISEDTYRKVAQAATDTGVLDGVADSRVWMAEQFNLYRGLDAGSITEHSSVEKVDTDAYAQKVIDLVNEKRVQAGLHTLETDSSLMEHAAIRAEELSIEFSHIRPDGTKETRE